MISTARLITYLDQLLGVSTIPDYCPNGLQVEGKAKIDHLVSGVTACQALLNEAMTRKADAILVHHGYFWKQEDPCVTGIKKNRLKSLLAEDINLLVYHLPLDLHLEFGNNIQLGNLLGIETRYQFDTGNGLMLGFVGEIQAPISGIAFSHILESKLGRKPLHIDGSTKPVKKIAWCTGAAQNFLERAIEEGVSAYLTGEVSEQTFHIAKEYGIHFYAAGHHATERYGVKALGEHLAKKFALTHEFLDINNPV